MRYGVPYLGSKSGIADKIIAMLPPAEVFVDLFAGGCAMTHAALLSCKYRRVIANDLDGRGLRLFLDAAAGKHHDERRWISREVFHAFKETDPYIAICWSFGNSMENYLYSAKIEPYKKALHEMIFAQDVHDRRLKYRAVLKELAGLQCIAEHKGYTMLQHLEALERLQHLERLERLERLEPCFIDYRDVPIPAGAIVYCDPPYKGTNCGAYDGFDSEAFFAWAAGRRDVVISEYAAPDGFVCAAEINHMCRSSANGAAPVTERLFVPDGGMALTKQLKLVG